MKKKWILTALLLLLFSGSSFSQTFRTKGVITGWLAGHADQAVQPLLGLRYIPTLSIEHSMEKEIKLDAEFSLNAYGNLEFQTLKEVRSEGDIKPYRMWLRLSTRQFEARVGLQKINFGSALMFRPLMWFDRLDPRDPLQLTDGIYGLLLRYYFLNNVNIWLWGLYGNNDTKGWELIPTSDNTPEFGGRIQVPAGKGELGLSFHNRTIDLSETPRNTPLPRHTDISENRLALDGKWDIGVGIWFEGTVFRQNSSWLPYPWQQTLTLGVDYTFGIGNGLHVVGEHFLFTLSSDFLCSGQDVQFSALSLNYPLGLLDSLSGMVYYDWENHDFYRFINWQRTYNRWQIYIMGFWNPEEFLIYQGNSDRSLFTGTGFQIMIVYNY
ncbi:MAG: hypothetical protein GF421_04985 [Candidatus Aminicenantes bacterium]|nr:hypothetical protein [Candidatus Aminicenantes bacterium]